MYSQGPGPNAAQRKLLAARLGDHKYPTAVVTDSFLARGAVTALGWLGHSIRAFPSSEVLLALEYLPVLEPRRRDVLLRLVQMVYELESAEPATNLASFDLHALARELSAHASV